ncbi:PrgI family protein [Candidatus Giovannonibacteria bacterium]|nr:PrgI family protein [Candidatus Giovannonibacteria bacterium]
MQQFHVPQFIEVEDKIFWSLTLKQFIYVIGGGGIAFIMYVFLKAYLPFFIILTLALPVIAFFLALAFYKINGQPFIKILESALNHYSRSRLFIWKRIEREEKIQTYQKKIEKKGNAFYMPNTAGSKLKDISWALDIHGRKNIEPET